MRFIIRYEEWYNWCSYDPLENHCESYHYIEGNGNRFVLLRKAVILI